MKYAWIKHHAENYPVKRMCRLLHVSRSAYYDWLQRAQSAGERDDAELTEMITVAFKKGRATDGTRRIKQALSDLQRTVSRRRIGRLMRQAQLACKTKRNIKATPHSKHDLPIADNHLDRQFTVTSANQVPVGDIPYIHTQEGWLSLAVVIDLFSRHVVGGSMAEHLHSANGYRSPIDFERQQKAA